MKTVFCFIFCLFVFDSYSQIGDTILFGRVIEYKTKKPISNAVITIVGTSGTSFEIKSNLKGEYYATKNQLKEDESYIMTAGLPSNFFNKTQKTTLVGGFPTSLIEINFELEPIIDKCHHSPPFLRFQKNKREIAKDWQINLECLLEVLIDNPTIVIEIAGHADFREKNPKKLSRKRAEFVFDYLVKNKIEKDRIVLVCFEDSISFTVPFDINCLKAGDKLTKEYVNELKDIECIEETIELNAAAQFKVLRSDYKPKE